MKSLFHTRIFVGIAVLAVVVSVLAVGRPILASDGEVPPHDDDSGIVTVEDPAEALRITAELLASQEGVTVDQSHGVLLHQIRVDAIDANVVERDESVFAGVLFEGGFADPRSTNLIRGVASAGLLNALEPLGSDVAIQDGLRFSRSEMELRSKAVHRALVAQGYDEVSTGVRHQTVEVSIGSPSFQAEHLTDFVRLYMEQKLGQPLGEIRDGDLVFGSPGTALIKELHSYGGDQLNKTGSVNECTSGFTVTGNSNGLGGVLTAAHCTGIVVYEEENGNTYAATWQGQHYGYAGDFEWLTTTHSHFDDLYYATGARMDLSAVQSTTQMSIGDWVCNYGRASAGGELPSDKCVVC